MKTETTSNAVNLELTARILTNGRNQSRPNKTQDKKVIYTAILFVIPIIVAIVTSI